MAGWPVDPSPEVIEARFWAKVSKRQDGCWEWQGALSWSNGKLPYGLFQVKSKKIYAHRYAYELVHGSIAKGLQIDHTCRNTRCVNIDHLEAVTPRENQLRSPSSTINRTHCPQGHPYNEENTWWLKTERRCRICLSAAQKRWKQKKDAHAQASITRTIHCPQGHDYSEDNTLWIRGSKHCRICMRARKQKLKEARHALKALKG